MTSRVWLRLHHERKVRQSLRSVCKYLIIRSGGLSDYVQFFRRCQRHSSWASWCASAVLLHPASRPIRPRRFLERTAQVADVQMGDVTLALELMLRAFSIRADDDLFGRMSIGSQFFVMTWSRNRRVASRR